MYLPSHFVQRDLIKLQDFVDAYNFGIVFCPSSAGAPEIVHMPFLVDRTEGPKGTLVGHVARANPVWRLFDAATTVAVVFQGPHGYISPTWYTSRGEVPTWNYAVVHVEGKPVCGVDDELTMLLDNLVKKHEGAESSAWSIREVREEKFAELKKQIVGFRIPIENIVGKFKLGQNRTAQDRRGAIEGLRNRNQPLDRELAELMAAELASLLPR